MESYATTAPGDCHHYTTREGTQDIVLMLGLAYVDHVVPYISRSHRLQGSTSTSDANSGILPADKHPLHVKNIAAIA